MGIYTKAGENLVRHRGGTYYLQAKVAGKAIRVSLETDNPRIAKLRRDTRLDAMRKAAGKTKGGSDVLRTIGDGLAVVRRSIDQPHLKTTTKEDYKKTLARLEESLPVTILARSWSPTKAAEWWSGFSGTYNGHKVNQALRLLRLAMKALVDHGAMLADPTAGLKRMKIIETSKQLPSREMIEQVFESIRTQKRKNSKQSADFVGFLAFSGCRIGEARHVQWSDVKEEWVQIAGGKEGTKNRKVRWIPISPALRALLDGMRKPDSKGPLFKIGTPRFALNNACDRLGIPHLRIHDLRHWFASWAIEKGVEIPTVAAWLGHQDGGALLMETYGHLRDAHSLASAKKLE